MKKIAWVQVLLHLNTVPTAFCFISSFCFTLLSPRKWNNKKKSGFFPIVSTHRILFHFLILFDDFEGRKMKQNAVRTIYYYNIQCVNPWSTITWAPGFSGAHALPPLLFPDQSQAWDFLASHANVQLHTSVQRSIALPACDLSDWIAHFGPCETPQNAPKLLPADPTYLFL